MNKKPDMAWDVLAIQVDKMTIMWMSGNFFLQLKC